MPTKQQGSAMTREYAGLREPDMYDVLLINDDFTPMDFVVRILEDIFFMDADKANAVMLDVHHHGEGVAGTYTLDIARSKAKKAVEEARAEGHPLRLKLRPHN